MPPRKTPSNPQAYIARKKLIPPRPELSSLAAASLVGALVFAAAGDIAYTLISWIIVFLLALPFSIILREIAVLSGTRELGEKEALKVYDWIASITKTTRGKLAALLYTYREKRGLQVVGLGDTPTREEQASIAFAIHKAAWLAKPLPVSKDTRLFLVVPGLVFERLASIIREAGPRKTAVITSKNDAKLVYQIVKSLTPPTGSKEFTAYIAVKAFRQLLLKGLITIDPELLDTIEKNMPFENPLVKRRVRKHLEEEEKYLLLRQAPL